MKMYPSEVKSLINGIDEYRFWVNEIQKQHERDSTSDEGEFSNDQECENNDCLMDALNDLEDAIKALKRIKF